MNVTMMTTMLRPGAALLPLLLAAAVVVVALPGCAPLLIGGAIVGGGMVAVDRRTSGAQLEDEAIELKAVNRISGLATLGHVNVTSYNRLVLLTGEVPTAEDRTRVEETVRRMENVRGVVNEIAHATNSGVGQRSSDTLLSGKVKATFLDAKDLQANAIKVVTERANVYLMGRVTEREAARAATLASGVNGVQKVVRVFEVISEEELAGISSAPSAAKP